MHTDRVVIQLTPSERALSLHRREVVIQRSAITSALITEDPWVWLRGVRAPGVHLPGRLACGTWRNLAGRDFVLARKGRAAVVIDVDAPGMLDSHETATAEFDGYARVILSTTHAGELMQALRLEGDRGEVFTTDTIG